MMEAQVTMYMLIPVAVGAGLLAVLVVWLSKHIANEKTRSQGVTIAAITLGVLLMGLFVTRVSHRPREAVPATPVAPTPPGYTFQNGDRAGAGAGVLVPGEQPQPPVVRHMPAQLAWGPLAVAAVAVAVVVLVATSRKGLGAALAGLGIAGVVLSMIFYAATDRQMIRETAEVRAQNTAVETPFAAGLQVNVPTAPSSEAPSPEAPSPEAPSSAAPSPAKPGSTGNESPAFHGPASYAGTGGAAHDAADEPSPAVAAPTTAATADRQKTAEAAVPSSTGDTAESPPPAWIDDEPTVTDGVYRAVVVSGPYSTKRECEMHLDEPLRKAMMEYAEAHLPPDTRFYAWLDAGYVRNNLIEDRYLAEKTYENLSSKMYSLHVRLKVEPRHAARFAQIAQQSRVRRAVEAASAGGVFVFGALVVLYGGLRFVGRKKRTTSVDEAPIAPAEATTPR